MKKNFFWLLACILFVAVGCGNNTYNDLRKKEDKLIANYISRNNLVILHEEPSMDHVWAENEYYKMAISGYGDFYFHLIERGDSARINNNDTTDLAIIVGDIIVARYKQFDLTENPDTLSYWTTLDQAYPFEFHYGNLNECESAAWHSAVRLMKYPNSRCQIIVPSKAGFPNDQTTVTPYVYIIKIKVKQ